jgi:hypothetical protein
MWSERASGPGGGGGPGRGPSPRRWTPSRRRTGPWSARRCWDKCRGPMDFGSASHWMAGDTLAVGALLVARGRPTSRRLPLAFAGLITHARRRTRCRRVSLHDHDLGPQSARGSAAATGAEPGGHSPGVGPSPSADMNAIASWMTSLGPVDWLDGSATRSRTHPPSKRNIHVLRMASSEIDVYSSTPA